MSNPLLDILRAQDSALRHRAVEVAVAGQPVDVLLRWADELDAYRRQETNLYQRVRAMFFLHALYRYHLPTALQTTTPGLISYEGFEHLLNRRFEEAIDTFRATLQTSGATDGIFSALAAAYHDVSFQTLASQVRRSVRSVRGNQWMFRIGHPHDQPLRIRPEMLQRSAQSGTYPILAESTAVRMDLSHCAWSDIFFLGMDYPQGARVLNVSIDLAVHGRDKAPKPPVEAYLRVIDEPVIRLVSVDLGARADVRDLVEMFDFARDYLSLLKAAVIAAGLVPPGMEGSGASLQDLLTRMVGPGLGLELVSNVNNIPKGSRLAVSTNLLGAMISACMRATGQTQAFTGPLNEPDRRTVAARAILGEWLGGSGGGWQDSGGIWPGMKLITGAVAGPTDPEYGISQGRLLPNHHILTDEEVSPAARQALEDSLVLVHGGMSQNVGPILEMVTEKYLLRSGKEWKGRQEALAILDEILAALRAGDIKALGHATTRNFTGPLQTIIPWATNFYTETLIAATRAHFGADFWGFWMLGGMSGGGMGFIFAPHRKREAQDYLQQLMTATRKQLSNALPFAMEPVVYDFAINPRGTCAQLLQDQATLLPAGYYAAMVPRLMRQQADQLTGQQIRELELFGAACRENPSMGGMVQRIFDGLFPRTDNNRGESVQVLQGLLEANGFDPQQHERIRQDLLDGRIGLAQNRLAVTTTINDVTPGEVTDAQRGLDERYRKLGADALAAGAVGVVTLAAGVGSRWTQGAGVCKALHPFCRLAGKHRSFVEVHLAKSRKVGTQFGATVPHVVTTSYLTHQPSADYLKAAHNYNYPGPLVLSAGRSIGLRMIPMERDLRFAWEQVPQRVLDVQQQKVRASLHTALINWARTTGEGADYTDNKPMQCLHPIGHFYELPNMLRNGVLADLLAQRPQLKYLMLHNIDTLGATLDPALLGLHIASGNNLTFEVITRRLEDRGGGLAKVDGRLRLVEGLAMPHETDEFRLSYYNTMTTWIDIDGFLAMMGLNRSQLGDEARVTAAVRTLASRLPTYVTLKDVKKRWGHGQEDIFPVAQFEKLWSDLTVLPDVSSGYVVVPRLRGQQMKEQAQLDGWLRDGSAAYIESLGQW